jgi:hypothetical protein
MENEQDPTKVLEVEKANLFPGALDDTRSEEEKNKDYQGEEVVSFGLVDWKEKHFEDIKTFPVRNQDGSSSCVMATSALMLGILNFLEEGKYIEFSFKDGYDRRSNKPGGGMIGVNALDILRDHGLTLNALIPSDNQSESQISKDINRQESDIQIAKTFRIKNFVQLPFDIEKIAWTMQTKERDGVNKPIMTWYRFPRSEWTAQPKVGTSNEDWVHHSVTGLTPGLMNGEKGFFTQDSWGLHSSTVNGLRFISESFLKKRMTFCADVEDLFNNWRDSQLPAPVKPPMLITKTLKFGMNDGEVKNLQDLLKYFGHFTLTLDSTGFFGAITKKAVQDFQLSKGLVADGIVGLITRTELSK